MNRFTPKQRAEIVTLYIENSRSVVLTQRAYRPEPKRVVSRRAQHFGVSGSTLQRILKDDFHLFSYKLQLTQIILPTDRRRCLKYGQTVARMVDTEPDFWKQILMTNEAHFTLSGGVNKQNFRIWGTENPREIRETLLYAKKVTVWAGVCAKTIIGPYFFRENKIYDGNRYRSILAYYICPQIREKRLDGYWFQ